MTSSTPHTKNGPAVPIGDNGKLDWEVSYSKEGYEANLYRGFNSTVLATVTAQSQFVLTIKMLFAGLGK